MIYCSSCSRSDFGKVSVPVPVPAPVPNPDNTYLECFSTTENVYKFCLFNVSRRIIAQKIGLSFLLLYFLFHFILDPYPNTVLEPDPEPAPEP
jgi:hypothetical protein